MFCLLLALLPLLPLLDLPQNPEISELLASNQDGLLDEDGDASDWIEIHNSGAVDVDLGGYFLTDDAGNLMRWMIPSPTILPAGDYLVVFASDKDRAVSGQELHTDFKLTTSGEYLGLVLPDGTTIQSEYAPGFPAQEADISYGRRFNPGISPEESFFLTPTPGASNGIGGPVVRDLDHLPEFPTDLEDIVVTAEIDSANVPMVSATLITRLNYGAETSIPMADDGIAPDLLAGDGLWTASIPASFASPGQMVRWRIDAVDNVGSSGVAPLNLTTESAEYFGTAIADPAVVSDLATLYWFVENPGLADTQNGTRCSIWYDGRFYDNQYCRTRGGSTSGYPKKSYKIDFNSGEKFRLHPEIGKMEEINLNTTWSDKAYIRRLLSWETYANVGAYASLSEMMHVMQNGSFKGMFTFVEQVDDELLDRLDLDDEGALYKMYNECTSAISGVEKKNRAWEDNSDLQDLVNGVATSGTALETFLFDNVDLPAVVSYLVGTSLIHDNDHVAKNYYLYRDSDGDREWLILPWDKDLTFGRNYTFFGGVLNDTIWADRDPQSHPLFGDQGHKKVDGYWNRFVDACHRDPRVREMYVRRLWTVMDQELQVPGTPPANQVFENRIEQLRLQLAGEVAQDVAVWGSPTWGSPKDFQQGLDQILQDYLPTRRIHFFQTHSLSGVLPGPPATSPTMTILAMEPDPVSGDDDEEWVQLQNPTADAVDLSGWTLTGGIGFTIAPGTVVPAGETVYLSPDLAAFRSRSVSPKGGERLFVVGAYDGNLRVGEDLFLWDSAGALITSNSDDFALFVGDMVAGQNAVVSIAGGTPNASVYLGWSQTGGGPTSTPFGFADLSPPIQQLPTLTTDASGTASLQASVPAGAAGIQLWFQALDITVGLFSNGETRVVQ